MPPMPPAVQSQRPVSCRLTLRSAFWYHALPANAAAGGTQDPAEFLAARRDTLAEAEAARVAPQFLGGCAPQLILSGSLASADDVP